MTRKGLGLVATVGLVALLLAPSITWAQVAPTLGTAQQFGVLGGSAVTGSTGAGTVVNGDVGSYPTPAISNFPPSRTVAPFIVHNAADGVVQQAQTDARAAYNFLASQGGSPLPAPPAPDELGGRTLGPGVYSLGAANLASSTTLTLNGAGVFIFNVSSTLVMGTSSAVIGTANPCNVFWRVGTSATLNGVTFVGTVIADVSITLGGGNVAGRLLALTGAVTMPGAGGNTIGGCSTAPPPPPCPVITLSPPTLPNGTVGVAYSQTIVGSGGLAPYTFTVTGGTLPAGLTLTTGGVLSGTPTTAASSTFTIRGTDANGCFAAITYTIVIAAAPPPPCPAITLSPPTLPNGIVGVAYSQTILGSGGTAPYTFAVTSGALPAGLTLTPAGVLAGTPTTAASSTFTIRGTDANGCSATVTYAIVIAAAPPPPPTCPPITLAPPTLPNGIVGVAYSQTIVGSGGTAPYVFGVTAGALPSNLTLTPAGLLAGTPGAGGGTSSFIIRATDANGCFAELPYTIAIAPPPSPPPTCPPITLPGVTPPNGIVGVAYSQTITASGGTAPYVFGLTSGALPAGLTLTPSGLFSGTPTTAGTSNFTIRATDANGCFAERSYTLVIAAAPPPPHTCPPITISPATLPNATVGVNVNVTMTGSGGTAPYVFGVTTGVLPTGVTLTPAGVLSGRPTNVGTSTFTIRGTDANGCFAERTFTVSVVTAVPTLPQLFVLLLALGLTAAGYARLRRRTRVVGR